MDPHRLPPDPTELLSRLAASLKDAGKAERQAQRKEAWRSGIRFSGHMLPMVAMCLAGGWGLTWAMLGTLPFPPTWVLAALPLLILGSGGAGWLLGSRSPVPLFDAARAADRGAGGDRNKDRITTAVQLAEDAAEQRHHHGPNPGSNPGPNPGRCLGHNAEPSPGATPTNHPGDAQQCRAAAFRDAALRAGIRAAETRSHRPHPGPLVGIGAPPWTRVAAGVAIAALPWVAAAWAGLVAPKQDVIAAQPDAERDARTRGGVDNPEDGRRPWSDDAEPPPTAASATNPDRDTPEGRTGVPGTRLEMLPRESATPAGAGQVQGADTESSNQGSGTGQAGGHSKPPEQLDPKGTRSPDHKGPSQQPKGKTRPGGEEPSAGVPSGNSRGKGNVQAVGNTRSQSQRAPTRTDAPDVEDEEVEDDAQDDPTGSGVMPLTRDRNQAVSRELSIAGNGPPQDGRGGPTPPKKSRGTAALVLGLRLPDTVRGTPNPGTAKTTLQPVPPKAEPMPGLERHSLQTERAARVPGATQPSRPDLADALLRYARALRGPSQGAQPGDTAQPTGPTK